MKNLILVIFICLSLAFSQRLSTEDFSTLDREIAGLMDAWVNISEGQRTDATGLFTAGTAVLRAEKAFQNAKLCNVETLPAQVDSCWSNYLKSSADCIIIFQMAIGSSSFSSSENNLLTTFARWETCGEEFLESVQSTR